VEVIQRDRRGAAAALCLAAFLAGFVPASAESLPATNEARAIALLNGQTCTQRYQRLLPREEVAQIVPGVPAGVTPQPSASPSSSASPAPGATPTFGPIFNGSTTLYATPRPQGTPTASPLPVPTATTNPYDPNAPVFVQRGGETPPPITPAGEAPPSPTPQPSSVPTLGPNYIAVLADKVTGNTNQGQPGDAIGNVHILYQQEEIVGERAHYDGIRTIRITGNPYIINRQRDSVLAGDEIVFDTIDQTAKLVNGNGTSAQGLERGLVHFKSKDLHTDADGVGHGLAPNVTTCENARSGYHITGRNMDVFPGDKIVIYRAILWLGAAAVFLLPKVVIPLRSVEDQRQQVKYFPDLGYDQYEGYWIKMRISFGRDQYYYGYYRINYFTKVGLGLGYVGFYQRRDGRRSASLDAYGIQDHRTATTTYNLNAQEIENFSQTLRGTFNLGYQSNYGPYTNLPANTNFSGNVVHQGVKTSQNYGFSSNATGSQFSSTNFSFTDSRQFSQVLSNALSFTLSSSQSNFGGASTSSNASAHFNDLAHFTTAGADYQLTVDKNYSQQPYGIDRVPELQVRPYKFFDHFVIPTSAQFTLGEYSEPENQIATQRADLAFVLGPILAHVVGSDFSATFNVRQDAYGTGDLKAQIQQTMSLTTALGSHFVNSISYNEANYNGPPFVPFQNLDQQPIENSKNGQDLVRLFNGDNYNLALGFSTSFNALAQPVSYQLSARPTQRSVVLLGGSFAPGPGQGFAITNLQLASPFGRDASIQFVGDLDWKNKGRIENKIVYYTRTIGDCYQLQALYNQSLKLVTVQINLLAFPSRAATFGIGQSGPLIPSTFNF
jgi:hypothetical protein